MSPAGRRRPKATTSLWRALRRARRPGSPSTSTLVKALPRLVTATVAGRYDGLGRGRLALMTAAAAYVVSPVDLLPEGVLGPLGLVDDAAVLTWLAGTVLEEAEAFLAWERRGSGTGSSPGTGPGAGPRGGARPGRAGGSRGGSGGSGPDVVPGEVIR